MRKTTLVAFLLLASNSLFANNLNSELNLIESQWANIYHKESDAQQRAHYPALLKKTLTFQKKRPESVELMIWQAIILATNAAFEPPFAALESLDDAKALLESAIQKKPNALGGAAYVTLGTLYYLAPGWPISFGNQDKAEQLLKKSIEINPKSIDSNYFYADYLLSKDKIGEAAKYFKLALSAPIRPEQQYADSQLKKEAQIALKNTEQRKLNSGRNKFLSLFFSAQSN